jgi:hypothetical protein
MNNLTKISTGDVDFSREPVIWNLGPLVHAAEVLLEWRVRATPAVLGRLEGCCRFADTEGIDPDGRFCKEDRGLDTASRTTDRIGARRSKTGFP